MKFSKLSVLLIALTLNQTVLASTTDSTKITPPIVNPVIQSYLLAQGTVQSNPGSNSSPIVPIQVEQRCPAKTTPTFKSSLEGTYENSFYAAGGIVNRLLFTSDYKISGVIYMSNRGAVGSNNYSPVTMNWQVWCS